MKNKKQRKLAITMILIATLGPILFFALFALSALVSLGGDITQTNQTSNFIFILSGFIFAQFFYITPILLIWGIVLYKKSNK